MRARARARATIWHALLVLATLGLLAVAVYAAQDSPEDGPSATPFLMVGLLSLCLLALALISAVDAALWARATRLRWVWWLALVLLVLTSVPVLFVLVAHASDPNQTVLSRRTALVAYVVAVIAAYVLNRKALARWRLGRSPPEEIGLR